MPSCGQLFADFVCNPFGALRDLAYGLLTTVLPEWLVTLLLTLVGAAGLVDVLSPALREGREGDPHLLDGWAARMDRGYRTFGELIYRFYHSRLVANLFFGPRRLDHPVGRGIVSVLAGDVWREDNPFQAALLRPARHGPLLARSPA